MLHLLILLFIYYRHILAIIHFNSNLQREVKKLPDGTEQISVQYPKFKNGLATVKNVRVKQQFGKNLILNSREEILYPNCKQQTGVDVMIFFYFTADYVEDIFQTCMSLSHKQLSEEAQHIKESTPAPMNTMLEKQSKDEAIKQWKDGKSMAASDIPPTTSTGNKCNL